jgi:thiol-disulfide isomerase/thioredoxin
MSAFLAVATYQRPPDLTNFSWRRWLIRKIPAAAAFVFVLHFQYVVVPAAPVSPIAGPLAEHLTAIGAKFYGASWCEHCQQQKSYFGQFAERLPYVECKPGGPNAPTTRPCLDNYISIFPTWIIQDRRVEGVLTPTELADLSGFKAPPSGSAN